MYGLGRLEYLVHFVVFVLLLKSEARRSHTTTAFEDAMRKETWGNFWIAVAVIAVILGSAIYVLTPEWRFQQIKQGVRSGIESAVPKAER